MEVVKNCSNCRTPFEGQDIFCTECGYPENGSDKEKDLFYYRIKLKKDVIEEARKKMKNVKGILIFMAVVNLLFGIYYTTSEATLLDGIVNLIIAGVFGGCTFWVDKQPLTGVLAGFIFWILIQLLLAIGDPLTLIHGFIWKFIFIGIFIKGIMSARDVKKYSADLKALKAI